MSKTIVPVQMAEGVEAWLKQVGMEEELQTMLDWEQTNLSGLQGIRVALSWSEYTHLEGKRCAVIYAHRDLSDGEVLKDMSHVQWGIWKAQTFSPRVCGHFVMTCAFHPL